MSDGKQYPLADLWRNRRTVQVPVVYHGRIESGREQTETNTMQGQPSDPHSDVIYRCHCPRCQAIAEDPGTYEGWLSYHCHCGAVWRMPREWSQVIPYDKSATGIIQGFLDARD